LLDVKKDEEEFVEERKDKFKGIKKKCDRERQKKRK